MQDVSIQMMGAFVIRCGDQEHSRLAIKSHKGVSLVEYLILHEGQVVSNHRLYREFWSGRLGGAPEVALKTLVSRTRALLNETIPDLGRCIVSEKGGYTWKTDGHVTADASEILAIVAECKKKPDFTRKKELITRLQELYVADLFQTGDMNDGLSLTNWLHREYLDAVSTYIVELRAREAYNEICNVCRKAIKVDELDDNLQLELMQALVNLNRTQDAVAAYQRVARSSRKYLDSEPAENLQEYYQTIVKAGDQIKVNLDVIRNELAQQDHEPQTPFICDYRTFKEFYNIQMRNLERFGHTMSLGMIMLGENSDDVDAIRLEGAMATLIEILRRSLRKGDIVTRFSSSIVALLLPTVHYQTGNVVMERIQQIFRQTYPDKDLPFYYRVSLLGGTPD